MIDVERRYFNRKGAITILVGVSFFLLFFSAVFNAFYCFGVADNTRDLLYFRYSIYLLAAYLLTFLIYSVLIRYIGFSYPIVIGFTATSFLANAVSGYHISRVSYCWILNSIIENPIGFEVYSRKAYAQAMSYIVYIVAVYFVVSIIPSFRKRLFILGRFWLVNLLTPLLVFLPIGYVLLKIPEAEKINYASQNMVYFITLMEWYAIRFYFKTLCYLILFPANRRLRLTRINSKRFATLVGRKPNFFRRYPPLLTEYMFSSEDNPTVEVVSSDTGDQPISYAFEIVAIETSDDYIDELNEELLDEVVEEV